MVQTLTNHEEIRDIFLLDFLRTEPLDPQNAFFSIVTISIFDPSMSRRFSLYSWWLSKAYGAFIPSIPCDMRNMIKLLLFFLLLGLAHPMMGQMQLLFEDSFDDITLGWRTDSTPIAQSRIADGMYQLKAGPDLPGFRAYFRPFYFNSRSAYQIEAQLHFTKTRNCPTPSLWKTTTTSKKGARHLRLGHKSQPPKLGPLEKPHRVPQAKQIFRPPGPLLSP